MIPGTQYDDYMQDNAPVTFFDGRGDDDDIMLAESLDTFSLSIDSIDM